MTEGRQELSVMQIRATPWPRNFRPLCRTSYYATLCYLAALVLLVDGAPAQAQSSDEYPIFGLQFSPDEAFLAAAASSNDPAGPIVIWNVRDWAVYRVHRPAKGSLDIDFSPDGTHLAYGTKAGVVGVLEVTSGNLLREIDAHSNAVYAVAFAADGNSLASAGADRSIKLWNLSSGKLIRRFDGHSDTVYGIAISADGKLLLSGAGDQEARLWNLATGEIVKTLKSSGSIVRRVAFSRDGKYFLVSFWDGKVRIRETATMRLRALLSSGSHCADISADEHFVATSGRGSTAEVFAVDLHDPTADEQMRIAKLIEQFQNDSYEVRVSAAEELAKIGMVAEPQLRAAMSHEDAEIRVRARHLRQKVRSPEPIARLPGHRGDVEVVDFAPDGRLLASGCRGGDIKIWDTSTFTEVVTLNVPIAE